MSEKKVFNLVHAEARRRALQYVAEAPQGYIVVVREPTRSLEQNAMLHALLTDVSRKFIWAGRRWDAETWKRLLVAAWLRATGRSTMVVPALDGFGVDLVPLRTSALSRRQCSELVEYIHAWCAEHQHLQGEPEDSNAAA